MRGFSFAIAAVALTSLAVHHDNLHAKEPVVLTPSSNWHIDFAAEKCRMVRTFGEGDNRHAIIFEQHSPNASFGLTVAGPSFDYFKSRKSTALRFNSRQKAWQGKPFKGDLGDLGSAMVYSSVYPATGLAFEEAKDDLSNQIDVKAGEEIEFVGLRQSGREVQLHTGPLAEAFGVMNQCTQGLLTDWGLDAEKHLSAKQLPQWQNAESVTKRIQRTYPTRAVAAGEQAIVRLRVLIDENGNVTDCVINGVTATDRLQSPACQQMQKAEFRPALDSERKPFKSYYTTSITYQIGR